MLTLYPATAPDAAELAPLLRTEDHAELLALGLDPTAALVDSVNASAEAWTYRDGDEILCMAGVSPMTTIGITAVPWLLGAPGLARHKRAFLVETRRTVDRWLQTWPVLRNTVDARYRGAIRWLDWLGFNIHDPFPAGPHGRPFWQVDKERH